MNLQESIRRILREEDNSLIPMIRRRVPHKDLEREFKEALDRISNSLIRISQDNGNVIIGYKDMDLDRFIDLTISILIDGIHYEIYSTMPLESQWYGDVYKSLKGYYKHRISVRHNQLMKRI